MVENKNLMTLIASQSNPCKGVVTTHSFEVRQNGTVFEIMKKTDAKGKDFDIVITPLEIEEFMHLKRNLLLKPRFR